MNITVLDGYTLNPGDNPWDALAELGTLTVYERTAPGKFLDRACDADILLTNKTPLDAARINGLPRLKFISVLATGYNVVDVAAAKARGIPVSNVPTYGSDSVAQHTLALLLELSNRVGSMHCSIIDGRWSQCADFCYWDKSIIELRGLCLGIVGFGRIGQQVARLGNALGMNIIYADKNAISIDGVSAKCMSVEKLFEQADIVTLHCNQTAENRHFVNEAMLSRMKSSAFLINTARGTLIDEEALVLALESGRLAGAALDVLSEEPPAQNHPLLKMPNCILTPHVAWSSLAARKRLMQTTAENIRGFLAAMPINLCS